MQLTNKSCQNQFRPHLLVSPPPPTREEGAVKGRGVLGGFHMMKGEGTGTGLPDRYLGGAAGRLVSEGMLNSDGEAFSISGLGLD